MKYVLDLLIIALVIASAVAGSRKGAVRILIALIGYVVAVMAAIFVSNVASEYVYDNYVKPYVISSLESKADSLEEEYLSSDKINHMLEENGVVLTDEQFSALKEDSEQYRELLNNDKIRESLNNVFKEYCESLTSTFDGVVPEEIIEEAERYLEENDMETDRMLTLITHEKESMVKIIENEILRPVLMKTVRFVLFAVTFAVVMLIVSVASYLAKVIQKIPVVNSANSFLGTMIGLLQGFLYTIVINFGVNMFIKFTSDTNKYLNTTIISETYVFGLLYDVTFYIVALILN
ncbi:MAG: CvpA family protein [Oscillospiraceae bacterium]|nr:CvpA family protein [Oscillospiraceae bacterium]